MDLPEDAVCLKLYIGETDRYNHQALYQAIVMKAREMQLAGATVIRGTMGFGASSRIHCAKVLNLSMDLPVIVEIVDSETKINEFLPVLNEMMNGGLATIEKLRVVRYRTKK